MDTNLLKRNPDIGYDFRAVRPRPKVEVLPGGPYAMERGHPGCGFREREGYRAIGCTMLTMAVVDENISYNEKGEGTRLDIAIHREAILLEGPFRKSLGLEDKGILFYDASTFVESVVDPNADGTRCPVAIQFYVSKREMGL